MSFIPQPNSCLHTFIPFRSLSLPHLAKVPDGMVVVGVGVVLAEDVEEERAGVVVDGLVFDEELREQAQVLAVPEKERKKERQKGEMDSPC